MKSNTEHPALTPREEERKILAHKGPRDRHDGMVFYRGRFGSITCPAKQSPYVLIQKKANDARWHFISSSKFIDRLLIEGESSKSSHWRLVEVRTRNIMKEFLK